VGLLCLLVVISRRYTPHVHCHGSFFCVRLCLPSLLYVMNYTLFRALYDEFLAGCCYVDHTFAVCFPVSLPVCYNAGFHMHFVICSPTHASRTFTLRPFYFSCVSLYVVPSISPDRTPCVSLGFLVMHSYGSCAFTLGTQRVFLFITPCVPCEFFFIFPGHYTSLWVPRVSFLSDSPCVYCANCNSRFSPCVSRSFCELFL